jgi:hypothetical protein
MTPKPQRIDALACACISATTGKVDIFIDIGNCISRNAVNLPKRRTWL